MSQAEKFEKYLLGFEDLQRALYFGAEAVNDSLYDGPSKAIQAEIDHFRSHK